MRIGIFTKSFSGALGAVMRQASAAGYECVQFNMAAVAAEIAATTIGVAVIDPAMPNAITPAVCALIVQAAHRNGVSIAALSGTYNMIHPDPEIRAGGLARLDVMLGAAAAMGVPLVTLCTGTRDSTDQWRHHPDNAAPDAWRDLSTEMARAVALADRHGVDLGIEPERANVVRDAAAAKRLLDERGSARLRIVLDPANLVEADDADPWRDTIAHAVELLGPHIAMSHAKDRAADNGFVTVGRGAIDFPHFIGCLRNVKFDGPLVTHGLAANEAAGVATFLRGVLDA